ncbi:RTC4-like domain-containing protein [Boletus edulis BED1]|uniref:Restriction of telomere capping protein 4 n=1 Tax=Boletus edulis BED1 TaxID=1328754 RepID=A0AAD4C5B2_BOLED|nr:RTC4-like domain-containing protein [Boletus edulis BED1]
MERLLDGGKASRVDVFSDPSHRMSQRPSAVKSGEGLGFQELSSTFGLPVKPVVTYGKSSKGKSKAAATHPPKSRGAPLRISEDESDDELLLSSQNSMGGDATPSSKRVVKGKKPSTPSDDEETVRVNGRVLAAHPSYKPSSFDAVKDLRFKKSTLAVDIVTEAPPPSSSLDDSQDLFKPISDDIEILDDSPPGRPSSPRPKVSETRRTSPTRTHTTARRLPDTKDSSTSKPPTSTKDTPGIPAKLRPRARLIIKSTPQKHDSSPEATPRPAAQKRDLPLRRPDKAEKKQTIKKSSFPSPSRREPQAFPMSLRAKENALNSAWGGDASSSKTKKAGISRAETFVDASKPMPLPSPLRTKPVSRGTTFPNLPPLSSSKDKGKARAKSPEEDDVELSGAPGKRSGPQPFPMSSQMLAGVDRRSRSSSIHSPKSTKRASSDSGAEQGRTAKKRKDSCSGVLDMLDYLHEPMEDDSIELGYARDPSRMCPYCDEELPSHSTPFLQHLLAAARKKSVSDPRPRNRGALKAPLTVYISVCQRHRFESHQLPIAIERGWPRTIDFTKVPARVKKMKKELEAIILDKDDTSDIEDLDADDGHRRSRSKSVFWREVKKEMKKQGSRAVVGVRGQFASFEKTQPGYYGEQGSVIIHQTLFDLFPPSTFDATLIAPLAPAEFIQRVLVPEAGWRLIAQDLCVDMEDAIVTLRDSAQYGVAMFPDTGENKRKGVNGDDDEMGVADQIVMERARARRKELAEEEKVEKEMMEEERAAQRTKARESRWEKAVERAQLARQNKARAEGEVEAEGASEVSDASATRRMQRGTRQWAVADDPESDTMSVDSLQSKRSARIPKKGVRDGGGKLVRATPQPDGSDSDLLDVFGDPKPKASIRRKKTKESSVVLDTRVKTETTKSREQKKPFTGFATLDSDRERESTPRPGRRTLVADTGSAADTLQARVLPLQVARNRTGASIPPPARDVWTRSLRTSVVDETDSDASNASRRSQRLVRPPIKKGSSCAWLFSDPDSPGST